MSPRKKLLFAIVLAWILGLTYFHAFGLTKPERQKVQLALDAVKQGLSENMDLRYQAAQARDSVSVANSSAGSAWASAFTVGLTAKKALDEAERCKTENDKMRPIVEKWEHLQGPWWFRGLNGLLYFIGRSLLSLLILIVVAFVIFLAIKIGITMFTGGTFTAGLGAGTKIFGKLGQWFVRTGKRFLSFFRRRSKTVSDNIKHRKND